MKALVIGKGISGKSANKLLKRIGYSTYVIDDNMKFKYKLLKEKLFSSVALAVVGPGVALDNEIIKNVKANNIELIGEVELATTYLEPSFIAITGTNGKTTTTSLTGELLSGCFKNVYVGGNIGIPVSSFALQTKQEDGVVLEISSFQLETIQNFRPKVACLLNITPDHLNRHKTMGNYIKTKFRIFENQTIKDFAVVNFDDPVISMQDFSEIKSQIYYFSTKTPCKGCYVENGNIYFNDGKVSRFIMKTSDVPLKGEHNLSNILAGLTCAILYGADFDSLAYKTQKFKGVSHRLEFIKEINGISYINDSKSTNISSTKVAMKAMSEPTTVILGGSDKGFDFDELFENIPPIIKNFVVIGETKEKILRAAENMQVSNVYEASSLKEAVLLATSLSLSGETVLLSPACASFDMFSNYEQRGKVFASIVREIEKSENSKVSSKKTKRFKI